jgi:hypothetical protein
VPAQEKNPLPSSFKETKQMPFIMVPVFLNFQNCSSELLWVLIFNSLVLVAHLTPAA